MSYETDWYVDRQGKKWLCVAQPKEQRMVCNSADGYFTCASFKTFAVWGWVRHLPQGSEEANG